MTLGCFAGMEGFDCSILWFIMIGLFFIGAVLKRQVTELLGIEFNLIFSTILAEIVFVVMMYVTHSMRWGFLVGLAGVFIGGFFGGVILGGGDSEYD